MARGINKVILVGTVGKDPEVRYFQSGDAYCTLSVATTEQWKDKAGEKQEKTEWHRVKFTRKLAEIVGEYVRKGQMIYVEGKLETQKYTDKQGIERYSTDVVANEMQMLGSRGGMGGEGRNEGRGEARVYSGGGGRGGDAGGYEGPRADDKESFDDDIPF